MSAAHLDYEAALASAKARRMIGHAAVQIGLRSPSHILSAATRKANQRAREIENVNAMRKTFKLAGRV